VDCSNRNYREYIRYIYVMAIRYYNRFIDDDSRQSSRINDEIDEIAVW
jgi:hypothetical protein